jgi:hypothetical protein
MIFQENEVVVDTLKVLSVKVSRYFCNQVGYFGLEHGRNARRRH